MTEVIGWLSSAILVATISTQVLRQWRSGTSKGVSRWLFIGQFVASAGFCFYSWLVQNWVFIATNGLLAIEALVGLCIVRIHRRREARASLLPAEPRELAGSRAGAAEGEGRGGSVLRTAGSAGTTPSLR